jgi:hypothetical protein
VLHGRSRTLARASRSTLGSDGIESCMFEDDDVFEDMPDTSGAAVSEQDWSLIRQMSSVTTLCNLSM